MNEQLQTTLADLIRRAVETAETSGQFLIGQLPDYVQQLLMWHWWEAVVFLVFWNLVALVPWVLGIRGFRAASRGGDLDDVGRGVFFTALGAWISGIATIVNVREMVKISVAPKVWLVEYAASLVK